MPDGLRIIGALFGGLIVLAVASNLYVSGVARVIDTPETRLEGKFNEFQREAQKTYPKKAPVVALADYAADYTAREIATTSDPELRAAKAAAAFMGFYLVNTRARPDYCREKGVDIAQFASAFAKAWRPAHAKATEVLARHGMTEEKLWQMSRSTFRQAVSLDMGAIGFVPGFKSGCDLVARKADLIVDKLDFNQRAPEAMRVLMGS